MKLPPADTYERELRYMPYRDSLQMVRGIVCDNAPLGGRVLDLMCGTGYLLGRLKQMQSNLHLFGVDKNEKYIQHARDRYAGINFFVEDALQWKAGTFDLVMCTGALHHIPYEQQAEMVEKIAVMTNDSGFAIVSDCYVDNFSNEQERQIAAAKLGYEYLKATIRHDAPADVVGAAIDILYNDVTGTEFKTSIEERLSIFKKHFRGIETKKIWPDNIMGGYGDYVTVLRK